MKKFFVLSALLLVQFISHGQCDKKVVFTCEKAVAWRDGVVKQEISLAATITLGGGELHVVLQESGTEDKINGTIKETVSCDWTSFLEAGKSVYKVTAAKEGESAIDGLVEVENSNGTLVIWMGDPTGSSKLQFFVKTYSVAEPESGAPATPTTGKEPKKKKRKA